MLKPELANARLKMNAAVTASASALIASGELSEGQIRTAKKLLNGLNNVTVAWQNQKISLEEFSEKSKVVVDRFAALRHAEIAASEKVKEFKEEIDALVDQFIQASNCRLHLHSVFERP